MLNASACGIASVSQYVVARTDWKLLARFARAWPLRPSQFEQSQPIEGRLTLKCSLHIDPVRPGSCTTVASNVEAPRLPPQCHAPGIAPYTRHKASLVTSAAA